MTPWIYAVRQGDIYLEFETHAITREDAVLQIAEDMRKSGYDVDMPDLMYAVHQAQDDTITG